MTEQMADFEQRRYTPYHDLTTMGVFLNTLRLRQKGRHFPYDIFKCILSNEYV